MVRRVHAARLSYLISPPHSVDSSEEENHDTKQEGRSTEAQISRPQENQDPEAAGLDQKSEGGGEEPRRRHSFVSAGGSAEPARLRKSLWPQRTQNDLGAASQSRRPGREVSGRSGC